MLRGRPLDQISGLLSPQLPSHGAPTTCWRPLTSRPCCSPQLVGPFGLPRLLPLASASCAEIVPVLGSLLLTLTLGGCGRVSDECQGSLCLV